MREWLPTIISVLSVLISFAAFYWRVKIYNEELQEKQTASQSEFIKKVTEQLAEIRRVHDKEMACMRLEMQKRYSELYNQIDERRRKDIAALHERVNNLEVTYLSTVGDRLGKIEGKMDSMNDTLTLIQRHFIENQGGGQ